MSRRAWARSGPIDTSFTSFVVHRGHSSGTKKDNQKASVGRLQCKIQKPSRLFTLICWLCLLGQCDGFSQNSTAVTFSHGNLHHDRCQSLNRLNVFATTSPSAANTSSPNRCEYSVPEMFSEEPNYVRALLGTRPKLIAMTNMM